MGERGKIGGKETSIHNSKVSSALIDEKGTKSVGENKAGRDEPKRTSRKFIPKVESDMKNEIGKSHFGDRE